MERLWLPVFFCIKIFAFDTVSSNQPPFVNFGSYNVFVAENEPIGTSLFSISATDADSTNVTFTMETQGTKDLVSMSEVSHVGDVWSVELFLLAGLDRDRTHNTRTLSFKVSDGDSEIYGQVQLIVRDVNDNPPMFEDLPYRIELEEGSSQINTTVLIANVSDPDDGPGGSVIFSMAAQAQGADDTYSRTFVIDENMGNIKLALPLDYETRSYYQYQIFAKDRGNPQCPGPQCYCSNVTEPKMNCAGDPATFSVIVKDVQDTPPFFERLPYIAQVAENTSVGTSFYQVSAQDGDRGVPNAVSYSIVDGASVPFTIDNDTGILRVGEPGLDSDQEDGRNYILTVMASEVIAAGDQPGGVTSATTQVAVTVSDINDNAPRFSQDVYYARVQENTRQGVPLTLDDTTIQVRDDDRNENGKFRLSVEQDGQNYTAFTTVPGPSTSVQGFATVMIAVFNSSVLDYETTKNLTFQLRATETSTAEAFSNTTTIVLTIEDMNDNSPVFPPGQTTAVTVTEHAAPGMVLATFTATDADGGEFGTISYSLEDGLEKFAMDAQSGNLTVTADVDREEPGGSGYSLVVVATDNMVGDEAQRRSTRLNIRVTVLDINDNPPEFQPHPPTVTVQENALNGTALMTLTAVDKDMGVNSDVIYKLDSIQSSGQVADQPQTNLFDIGLKTGIISVNADLIGYPGVYNVTFVASDSAPEPKNASTLVTVHVQDVNLNDPVFVVPDQHLVNRTLDVLPNITVPEEQPVGTLIMTVSATDADTDRERNGNVYYYLVPDAAGHFDFFSLSTVSGSLTVKQRMDREHSMWGGGVPMFQITLKAEDQGVPTRRTAEVGLRVILSDVNDKLPEFLPPATLTLTVEEEVDNVKVGSVNIAQDADSNPQHRITCYYVYGGEMVNDFFLTRDTGELRLLNKLDRDLTPEIKLVVKATQDCSILREDYYTASGGGGAYNASDKSLLQVIVKVIDKNDNPPVLDEEALTVGLLYDKGIGYEVINLAKFTTDEDTEANSRNYFRLVPGQGALPFSVTRNGSVLTTRLFSADENEVFRFRVEAFDSVGQTDEADVTVYLVSNLQRVKLVFNKKPNEVEAIKGNLIQEMSKALNMTIVADKIATHITTAGKADPNRTDMYIHARAWPDGEIVPAAELYNAFDYNVQVRAIFQDTGVTETMQVLQLQKKEDDDALLKAFIIVTVILVIILIVLIIVLIRSIRRYRRRLRAATTSAFVSTKDESNSYVPPGTNKYYAAENPLFGKDVKPVFIDRVSSDNDSLDDNAVVGGPGDRDGTDPGSSDNNGGNNSPREKKEEEQEMYLELYDDDDDDEGPGTASGQSTKDLCAYRLQDLKETKEWEKNPKNLNHLFNTVISTTLGRHCREWPEGKTDAKVKLLIEENSKEDDIIIYTDGSVTKDKSGWGFTAKQNGKTIWEENAAYKVTTSSLTMEVEAATHALQWLSSIHTPGNQHAMILTDSMNLIQKIENGMGNPEWHKAMRNFHIKKLTWSYCPGHAGVKGNERADRLAGNATPTSGLHLGKSEILRKIKEYQKEQVQGHHTIDRLKKIKA
ncbi:cadherin-23-like isoform X2 [Babylonia areolata]|uniref:cadherin-23-like isoform X2 n=1 Tax=Babylonia areolata TaxID=304850 RepID=UPI003FD36727